METGELHLECSFPVHSQGQRKLLGYNEPPNPS